MLTEVGRHGDRAATSRPGSIQDLFAGDQADNPHIIGFVWFDHSVNGNDWRIESSSAATSAFADGVADPGYGSGVVYTPG